MGSVAFGRVELRANGQLLNSKTGAIARGIGGLTRTPVVGDQFHGHTSTRVQAECEFSISANDEVSITDLAAITDGTITFESADGAQKTLVMRNAVCEGSIEITSGEGEAKFKFFGPDWQEV